jgi:hypothetical protein
MAEHGLDNKSLLKKHRELLNATRTIISGDTAIESPDYTIQSKALEMAFKLQGAFTEKHEVAVGICQQYFIEY